MVDSSSVKLQLLSTNSTLDRMNMAKMILNQLQDAQVNGCSVM